MNNDKQNKNLDFTVSADGAKWRTQATVSPDGLDEGHAMRVSYEGPAATPGPDGYTVYRLPGAIADRLDAEAKTLANKYARNVDFTVSADGARWRTQVTVGPRGVDTSHAMRVSYEGPAAEPGPDGYAVYKLPEAIADGIDEERKKAVAQRLGNLDETGRTR